MARNAHRQFFPDGVGETTVFIPVIRVATPIHRELFPHGSYESLDTGESILGDDPFIHRELFPHPLAYYGTVNAKG